MRIYGPNGKVANVNDQNQLEVKAITHSAEHYANHVIEEAYQVPFAVTPAGALDCFFYLKNTSEHDLFIEGFSYAAGAAETIYVQIANTGTAVLTDGTEQTPANCNAGSGHDADVTCYSGTANEAVDITGLAGGREIERLNIAAATDKKWHNFETDVIVPKNKIFSMWALAGSVVLTGTIVFYYHEA